MQFSYQLNGQTSDWATFKKTWETNSRVELGSIKCPENHFIDSNKIITIRYAILKAKRSNSGHPIIYFMGGPGGRSLSNLYINYFLEHPLNQNRDVILFDQRGIGYSNALPDMSMDAFEIMAKNINTDEELIFTKKLVEKFRLKANELNISLENYNSVQTANDIKLLFLKLGYEKYNLYGASYGGRLARMIQNLYPNYVEHVILDSPDFISKNYLRSRLENYANTLDNLFKLCQTDEECKRTSPRIRSTYFKAIKRLAERPITIRIYDSIDFVVNSQDGLYLLRRILYDNQSIKKGPQLIQAFIEGEGEILKEVIEFEYYLSKIVNLSLWLSVERSESFGNELSQAEINEYYNLYDLLPFKMGSIDAIYQAGYIWHSNSLFQELNKIEKSEIPTLIFVNKYDPATPPKNGHLLLKNLSNGTLVVLNEGGHGTGGSSCKAKIINDYLNDFDSSEKLNLDCFSNGYKVFTNF